MSADKTEFAGRTVLITGAARGIGRAIALTFAAPQVRLALTARSHRELEEVASETRARGSQTIALTADLEDRDTPTQLVKETESELGSIDILINNAALVSAYNPKPVVNFDDDYWDRSIRINLTVPYLLCKAIAPRMIERRWGRIIQIASVMSRMGAMHAAAYAATKHGLLGLTRTLALELAQDGVTVNAICPGPTETGINDLRLRYDANRLNKSFEELVPTLTPMGRRVQPDEVAALTKFLAGESASAITGQAYNIDCGQLMS